MKTKSSSLESSRHLRLTDIFLRALLWATQAGCKNIIYCPLICNIRKATELFFLPAWENVFIYRDIKSFTFQYPPTKKKELFVGVCQ